MNEQKRSYQIYGRKAYEEPLAFVMVLATADPIKEAALQQLGTEGWVELVAIPAQEMIQVIGESQ
ncbi:MAG: hypothetical protein H6658_10900 [Ardenticatenaceae bacterium]|nr:hypothetical protein [Ardenticatenaceae bacterium]